MAYIDQENDPRFQALNGLGGPGAPTPMGTPAPGAGASAKPAQAPQQSNYVNLQTWLGLNKGVANQAADNYAGYQANTLVGNANSQNTAFNNTLSDPNNIRNQFVTQTVGSEDGSPSHTEQVRPSVYQLFSQRSTEPSVDWFNRAAQEADNLSQQSRYTGPASLGDTSQFQSLQKQLGTMVAPNGSFANVSKDDRDAYLRQTNPSFNRYQSALLGYGRVGAAGNSAIAGAQQQLNNMNTASRTAAQAAATNGNDASQYYAKQAADNRARAAAWSQPFDPMHPPLTAVQLMAKKAGI